MSVDAATAAAVPGAWDSMVAEALLELAQAMQRLLGEVAIAHGLSLTQVRLLRTLAGGERRMTDLAGAIGLEKPGLSGLVDRAKARGLVSLESVPGDRRVKLVHLTPEGRGVASAVRHRIEQRLAELVQRLPSCDREPFQYMLSQILCGDDGARGRSAGDSRRTAPRRASQTQDARAGDRRALVRSDQRGWTDR